MQRLTPRLFIRRKTGYMSPYGLKMFYGAFVAGKYFSEKYGTTNQSTPHVQILGRFFRVPDRMMIVFKPFNRYVSTERGERFI